FGEFGFLLDGLSSPFAIMIYVLSTILVLYSKPYMIHIFHHQFKEELNINTSGSEQTSIIESSALTNYVNAKSGLYFALYLLFAVGMLGTVLSTNLIEFFVFFEIMLIPGFFLVALWGAGERRKIGLMFLFWTHTGAVVLLLGFLMIGISVGSFDFADINESEIPQDIAMLSAVAIALGLGVKLAVFMFHIWLPYVHGAAPTPISALLSPAMIGIGI
ncbi:MAG: formate hydrogenlyase, partial [Thaumarchaeota archaeon]|nr:formate hydrogenlyase [Nitrososphaerota archaeon]